VLGSRSKAGTDVGEGGKGEEEEEEEEEEDECGATAAAMPLGGCCSSVGRGRLVGAGARRGGRSTL